MDIADIDDDPRVKAYLDSACGKVRSKRLRQEIREELLSHLRESIGGKIEAGHAAPEALALAMAELGEAEPLARQFRTAHRPIYLQLPFLGALGLCVALIAVLFIAETSRRTAEWASARINEVIEKHRDRFLEDERILSAESFFAFPGKERDAGNYLNWRVKWEDSENRLGARIEAAAASPKIELSKEMSDRVRHWGKEWLGHSAEARSLALDFAWMNELHKFDHWDAYETGPLHEYLASPGVKATPWSIPIPRYGVFQDYAKLRLLRGIANGDLLSALRDTRQLARLLYSNEILVGGLVAVNILGFERAAYEYGLAHRMIKLDQWQPLSADNLIRAKRAIYSFGEIFSPWVDAGLMERVFDGKTATAGMCIAISEQLPAAALNRALFKKKLPFEMDLDPKFELMDQIVQNALAHCRASGFGLGLQAWRDPSGGMAIQWLSGGSVWNEFKNVYLARLPLFSRWVFSWFVESIPDYMSGPYRTNRLPSEKGP